MTIDDLKEERVGILGYGREGQALTDFLVRHKINTAVYDHKPQDEWPMPAQERLNRAGIKAESGERYIKEALQNCTVIFRSPGIKLSTEDKEEAERKNITLTSQTIFFFDNCPSKIIGITGTKGKGTTSTLIHRILEGSAKYAGNKVYLTGNIGKVQPVDFLEELSENDLVVYELSSFQLQDLERSPHVGVCLMITKDHLDYHDSLGEYHMAKSAIAKYQTESDILIFNQDYDATRSIAALGKGQKWSVSAISQPVRGALIKGENIHITGFSQNGISFDCSARLLRGIHNLENMAAAALTAVTMGVDSSDIQNAIDNFEGLDHRLQFVGEHNGVKFYNDSISTINETTMAAVESFQENIVLMVGGASKNLDYKPLVNFLEGQSKIKKIICIGETGKDISSLLKDSKIAHKSAGSFNSFEEAFQTAVSVAEPGDVILLSPASTSFDMFGSYEERGQRFASLFQSLNE